ncbi:putative dehydrogenase [Motilibacter peucedani]|uniref:Putative dehydrogenase n=1 Tax=Motilibacter peucedani TaxID=598650 RepID=A0A420XTH5_9ACTN|nr:Gfo/Idh/MocA family oxidoreductase [Motilibacter peucedani]RKS80114.1 putative dehydrogenase [Motilibacter peucedani]
MSSELRVAVLGYGLAGSTFHAPVINAVPGLRVTAVVTRSEERAAAARAVLPGVEVLASADEVFAAPERFDSVVVATPNRTHLDLARAALLAGLPVVVDKPLAVTHDEGQSLVSLARESGVLLTVYQNRRWDSELRTLQALLADDALGDVHRFESRFERWRPVPKPGWRESGDPADAGGLLNDLGSHLVDQALHLFGPATSVYAEVDTRRATVQVDDDVMVALTHASGVRSTLWASAVAADLGPRLRVLGSAGAYVVHGLDGQEEALRAGRTPADPSWGAVPESAWGRLGAGDDVRPVPSLPGAWQEFYVQWRDALLGAGPVPVDSADSVRVLAVLEAARTSSREQRVVALAQS